MSGKWKILAVVTIAAWMVFASQPLMAAEFPAKGKVITQIVPFGSGGGMDITARAVQPWLEKELGVPMPIINKPGGGGQIGFTEFVKTAKPDGQTLVFVLLPAVPSNYLDPKRKAVFSRKDFKLVANIAIDPVQIMVMPGSPYKTLKDLVAAAKANPGKIKVTSAGLMTPAHVAARRLELETGIKFAHMFYEQQGEQRGALLGGHADAEFNPVSETAGAVISGQLRSLGICDDKPSKFLPNTPTVVSQGYKATMASARGIALPAGTPDSIVSKMASAVAKVLAVPDNQKALDKLMLSTRFMSGKEYDEYWSDMEKTVKAVLDASEK